MSSLHRAVVEVSGVQPKVLVPGTISEKTTLRTRGYIVKVWGDDYPQLAANEYFCMTVAKACGLPIPDFYLSDNRRLFVMARFDREYLSGKCARDHEESLNK